MKPFSLLITLVVLTLVGCGTPANNQVKSETPAKVGEPKQIVVSFYPLAFITEQIVGNEATVINIAGSVDVHEYEPSPQDMVMINEADLVIYQGAALEPWADDVIPELQKKDIATLEVTHDIKLEKTEEHEEHEEEHHEADDHDDDHEDEGEHDEHHHGGFDPHTWLDPVLVQDMVDEILDAVVTIDNANKAIYETNAELLKKQFADLNNAFKSSLIQCAKEEVIVSHDAYGYLARRYGFKIHPISGLSTQDKPSAKILAELKDEAADGITHILIEENNIRRFADTLATETGLKTLPINPLGRGTLDPEKNFFDIMNENLNSLSIALHCQQ